MQTRDALRDRFAKSGLPASRVVLICDTALEHEWAEAGRMAGAIPAAQYFGVTT